MVALGLLGGAFDAHAQPLRSATEVDVDDTLAGPQRGDVWRVAPDPAAPGGLETPLQRVPSVQSRATGAEGQPAFLSIRGAPASHTRFVLDGIPLDGAFGGAFDVHALPSSWVARVTLHRSFVPLAHGPPPPGGVVAMETAVPEARSFDVVAGGGSFAYRRLSLAASWARRGREREPAHRIAFVLRGAENRFRYFEGGGTVSADDDRVSRRENADFDDAFALYRGVSRAAGWRVDALALIGARGAGIPGVSSAPLLRVRTRRLRADAGLRARAERGHVLHDVLLATSVIQADVRDPEGELYRTPNARTRDVASRTVLSFRPSLTLVERDALRWRAQLLAEASAETWSARDDTSTGVQGADRVRVGGGAETALAMFERLHLGVSLRADALGSRTRATAGGETLAPHDVLVSPQAGVGAVLTRSPTHELVLSATVAQTHRTPGFGALFGDGAGLLGNPELQAESQVGGDVALRVSWQKGVARGAVGAAFYERRARDLIVYADTGGGGQRAQNVGSAAMRGREFDARVSAWDRVALDARYTLGEAVDRSESATHGLALPYRPQHRGSVEVRATTPIRSDRLDLGAALDAASSFTTTRAGTRALPRRVELHAHATWHLSAAWRLRFDLRNLADARTERVPVFDAGERSTQPRAIEDLVGHPIPGRSVFLTLRGHAGGAS